MTDDEEDYDVSDIDDMIGELTAEDVEELKKIIPESPAADLVEAVEEIKVQVIKQIVKYEEILQSLYDSVEGGKNIEGIKVFTYPSGGRLTGLCTHPNLINSQRA